MKTLIVHYNAEQGGGAESAIRDQKRALEMHGHEVELAFEHPVRAYRRFRPDIVHFHTVHVEMGLGVLTWAQRSGIPHCLSLHDYWPFCKGRMLLARDDMSCAAVENLCDSNCLEGPAHPRIKGVVNGSPVVTFNEYSAAIYKRHGVRVDAVIPHAIDTDYFAPDHSKRTGPRIVTVSAWPEYPTKGIHILKAAIRKIGAKATLISGVSRERVRDELQASTIMVFPSCYEETWGLCLTEAMACGCACVASNVCGSKAQITHGVNGMLFENHDSDQLGNTLQYLLDNPDEVDALGKAAREWAQSEATLERMGRDYSEFYGSIAHG